MTTKPGITQRTLNRTSLARQYLLDRTGKPAFDVIRHLVAVQGQEPNWPYVGLWTRIEGFEFEHLAELIRNRRVVRSTTLRRTIHLTTAEDFGWLRPSLQQFIVTALKSPYYATEIVGVDHDKLRQAGLDLLHARTLSRRELAALLSEQFPERLPKRLADAVETLLPLVHLPKIGEWGNWRGRTGIEVSLPEHWSGQPLSPEPQPETLVLRYLAAFGPASVKDVQAWSGATRLREVAGRLDLRRLRGPDGQEFFDLPDAPLSDPDLPAPVRFLPAFDNAVLGYHDRTRIISDEDRKRFAREGSAGVPTYLVDGFVHGTWTLDGSALTIRPLRKLPKSVAAELESEARRLLDAIGRAEAARGYQMATLEIRIDPH